MGSLEVLNPIVTRGGDVVGDILGAPLVGGW